MKKTKTKAPPGDSFESGTYELVFAALSADDAGLAAAKGERQQRST